MIQKKQLSDKNALRKYFILTTFIVLASRVGNIIFNLLWSKTAFGISITNDPWHHYHFGIILLIFAFFSKKQLQKYFVYMSALGLGLFIDEYAQFLTDIGFPLPYHHSSVFDNVSMLALASILLLFFKPKLSDVKI